MNDIRREHARFAVCESCQWRAARCDSTDVIMDHVRHFGHTVKYVDETRYVLAVVNVPAEV